MCKQGLKLAREHDSSSLRTMGVVTKVDKADPGIGDKLTATGSKAVKLKLGFVAVSISTSTFLTIPRRGSVYLALQAMPIVNQFSVHIADLSLEYNIPDMIVQVRNRTQAELKANISSEELDKREQAFFKSHAELRLLPPSCLGKEALAKKLVKVQEERVLEKFPALMEQV